VSESDLKINSRVRRMLVERHLDTSELSISTTSGVVAVRGTFRKMSGREMNERDVVRMLAVLEINILRTKGVKRVSFTLKGWGKKKGKWVQDKK